MAGHLVVALVALCASACTGAGHRAPTALADGSVVRTPPVELEGVDKEVVLTSVRTLDAASVAPGTPSAACLRERSDRAAGPVVVRVSAYGTSATFRTSAGRGVYACDRGGGPPGGLRPWCGRAFGRLSSGRLRDPRLDLGCSSADGAPLAFAWIEPGPDAAYVTVRQHGFAETYAVSSGLPVRVSTASGIDLDTSSAHLDVSEHARDGSLIREYTVEAQVAG